MGEGEERVNGVNFNVLALGGCCIALWMIYRTKKVRAYAEKYVKAREEVIQRGWGRVKMREREKV